MFPRMNQISDIIEKIISAKDITESEKIKQIEEKLSGRSNLRPFDFHWFCTDAIKYGCEGILKLFVEKYKTDVNNEFPRYMTRTSTLLHMAAYYNRLSMIEYLVEKGAICKPARSLYGFYPFHVAIAQGYLDIVQFFVKKGHHSVTSPTKEGTVYDPRAKAEVPLRTDVLVLSSYPLDIAARAGHLHIVRYLIDQGATYEPHADRWDAIHEAASGGHLPILQLLIERFKVKMRSVDAISTSPTLPLHFTSHYDRAVRGEFAINPAPEHESSTWDFPYLTRKGHSSLNLAAKYSNSSVVIYLAKKGAAHLPDEKGQFPIHHAASRGKREVVQFFIEKLKIPINFPTQDEDKFTPLSRAIWSGDLSTVQYLVKNGAHLVDSKGRFVIHYAAALGRRDIVRFFVEEQGIPIDLPTHNEDKLTPLHFAVNSYLFKQGLYGEEDQLPVIQYLAQKGPPHPRNAKGQTPLQTGLMEIEDGAVEDDVIDWMILLFDFAQLKTADFRIMLCPHNDREKRFDLVNCALANSLSVEEGFQNLITKLTEAIPDDEDDSEEAEDELNKIKAVKKGLIALATAQKSCMFTRNIPNFLVIVQIEAAAEVLLPIALSCKDFQFDKLSMAITNHILSFLLVDVNLKVQPKQIAKAMHPEKYQRFKRWGQRDVSFYYENERARFFQRLATTDTPAAGPQTVTPAAGPQIVTPATAPQIVTPQEQASDKGESKSDDRDESRVAKHLRALFA